MSGLMMKYFVLKPAGTHAYAKASRMAMRKYADAIQQENPALATELREWTDREHAEAYAASIAAHAPRPKEEGK